MFTLTFWKAAAERAVNTFAQAFLAALLVNGTPTAFAEIAFWPVAQVALIAAGISVIKSVIVNTASQGDGPGMSSAETLSSNSKPFGPGEGLFK
jgi:hypothetical protein